jgi:dinuclear metal center YbgI/SA1388 family protein
MKTARSDRPQAKKSQTQSVSAGILDEWFEQTLKASRFKDYCPNGLQAEGIRPIRHMVCGVTASLALLRAAHEDGADAVLVHHGWFWRGEDPRLVGPRAARMRELIKSGMHLFAFHLPLDVHPTLGNNAQLALRLGWQVDGRCGADDLVNWHDLPRPQTSGALGQHLKRRLGQRAVSVGLLERPIRRVAWCTGAAQDLIMEAAASGADAFISGEISERTTHLARELGIVYLAAGHHATERFGVQALAAKAATELGFSQRFIDDPNPV